MNFMGIVENILNNYQWLVGIFLTAGLSFLIYFRILRINNFLAYSKKFHESMRSYLFLEKIEYRNGNLFYKNNGKEVENGEAVDMAVWFNLISEIGLLLRRGLIDEDLAYNHFGNNVFALYTRYRSIVDFIENKTHSDNINFLFRRFSEIGVRNKRKEKIRRFLYYFLPF